MEVIMTATDVNIESPAQGTEDDKLAELRRCGCTRRPGRV
jgi:hypothetical protein